MEAASLKLLTETLERLTGMPGVLGVVVCTTDGVPIRTTFDLQVALQYAALTLNVSQVARRAVKQLSHATYGTDAAQQEDQKKADTGGCCRNCSSNRLQPCCSATRCEQRNHAACAGAQPNELQHVRLRTAKHEIMIVVPEAQMDYFMVVVHATDTKAS